jgi:hypothetical protein
VTIKGNRFVSNSALNGGGTVNWLVSSSDMSVPVGLECTSSELVSGNYYENNAAFYGSNVSTDAFALTTSEENVYEITNYDSLQLRCIWWIITLIGICRCCGGVCVVNCDLL